MAFERNKKSKKLEVNKVEKFNLSNRQMNNLRDMRTSMGYSSRELSLFLGDLIDAVSTGEIFQLPSNECKRLSVTKSSVDYKLLLCFCYDKNYLISIEQEGKRNLSLSPSNLSEAISIIQSSTISIVNIIHDCCNYNSSLSVMINLSLEDKYIEYINCEQFKADFEQFFSKRS